MAKLLVTDELWEVIEPLLPEEPHKPKGGRPRLDDRAALTGIIFVVLKTGIPWEMLSQQEMGCGSGMTCWRRLEEWHEAGVWDRLRKTLLDRLGKRRTRSTGSAHRPWRHPIQREIGKASVGGGADAVVDQSLPTVEGALREAS